jgi:hypothetical protein
LGREHRRILEGYFCLFEHSHSVQGIPKQFMHQSPLRFDPDRLDSMVESLLSM